MKISKNKVLHVAKLAHLTIDEKGVEQLSKQISSILDYVDTLNQVDTNDVRPTSHALLLTNAFRDDTPKEHLDLEAALANAPQKENDAFIVPKII